MRHAGRQSETFSCLPRRTFIVVCPTLMDAELEKLVEAGKLPSKAAEKLNALKPGTFCLHKSWGFGRVAEWNLMLNQIVIDFTGKKGHPMQLQYAAENLTVIPAEHFLARKASDLAATKKLAKDDPVALVRNILESLEEKAPAKSLGNGLFPNFLKKRKGKGGGKSPQKHLKGGGVFPFPEKKT